MSYTSGNQKDLEAKLQQLYDAERAADLCRAAEIDPQIEALNQQLAIDALVFNTDEFADRISRADLKMITAAGRLIIENPRISDRQICQKLRLGRNWLYYLTKTYPKFGQALVDMRAAAKQAKAELDKKDQ